MRPPARGTDPSVTIVVDAGARYGIHPTWREFDADLLYLAFEPDPREAQRLRETNGHPGVEFIDCALGSKGGTRRLHLTRHRGYSSFLRPDLRCEWFDRYRSGEGKIEGNLRVRTCPLDAFARSRGLAVDFLKVDTEGTELEVLQGGQHQLRAHVMGLRINVSFEPCYRGHALFPEIHRFLLDKGFFLLNLDYFGRGIPRNHLFRRPDPISEHEDRYGTLVSTDGVWLKRLSHLAKKSPGEPLAWRILKYAYFCLINHAPDVAIDTLLNLAKDQPLVRPEIVGSRLYRSLRRRCAEYLGRWRVYPDRQWQEAKRMFATIFRIRLEAGHRYWEILQSL